MFDSSGGLYVVGINNDARMAVSLEQPQKIYSGDVTSNIGSPPYFWSSNGEILFIAGRNGLVSIGQELMR